jgi:hypothetical protein
VVTPSELRRRGLYQWRDQQCTRINRQLSSVHSVRDRCARKLAKELRGLRFPISLPKIPLCSEPFCVTFMPIIRRRGQPPNVLRFFQIDSAVSRLLWIDIDDIGYSPFACKKDKNPDFHAHAQCDGCQNQGAMKGRRTFRRRMSEARSHQAPRSERSGEPARSFEIRDQLDWRSYAVYPATWNRHASGGNGYISAAPCL